MLVPKRTKFRKSLKVRNKDDPLNTNEVRVPIHKELLIKQRRKFTHDKESLSHTFSLSLIHTQRHKHTHEHQIKPEKSALILSHTFKSEHSQADKPGLDPNCDTCYPDNCLLLT